MQMILLCTPEKQTKVRTKIQTESLKVFEWF